MCFPIFSQQIQGFFRKRNVSVFGLFAAMNMYHHPLTVYVGNLQMKGFLQPQAARIDGGEKNTIVECVDMFKNAVNFGLG